MLTEIGYTDSRMFDFLRILEHQALQTIVWGNSISVYVTALAVFLGTLLVLWLFRTIILARVRSFSKKTENDLDDVVVRIIDSVKPFVYVLVALYVGLRFVELSERIGQIVDVLLLIVLIYQVIRTVGIVIDYGISKKFADDVGNASAARFLTGIIKAILWVLGLLLVLQNVGIEVTSLIAGLGIGGIAIAFALQNILEDLFSSFAIFFDKPFEIGDTIRVGTETGTVEKIGIKTTRIRSVTGEEIVISNQDLTKATLHNMKRLDERRRTFTFGVVYEIDTKLLKEIPDIVRSVVESVPHARFDRAHLLTFGESSLDFEVTYHVESDDYQTALDTQQAINFGILDAFGERGIEMAYPTRVVYGK